MKISKILQKIKYTTIALFPAMLLSYGETLPEKNHEEGKIEINAGNRYSFSNYSLLTEGRSSFSNGLNERVLYNVTNNLTASHFINYFSEASAERETVEDIIAGQMKRAVERGIKQTLREKILETSRINNYVIDGLGGKIRDIISGREERNTLTSPFNQDEGIPGLERTELYRLPKNWEWGARPFRTNPYGFVTGKIGDSRLHLRSDIDDVELTWQKPLTKRISLTGGLKFEWKNEDRKYGFIGIGGQLYGGIFSAGSTISRHGESLLVAYSRSF